MRLCEWCLTVGLFVSVLSSVMLLNALHMSDFDTTVTAQIMGGRREGRGDRLQAGDKSGSVGGGSVPA